MFKKINHYLLTQQPLLWNTRIVWVIAVSLLLHLLFFLAGFIAVTTTQLQYYYSIQGVGNGSMYSFSILCSLAVIIVWLVFYLRNNAFKSFYVIEKNHLVKEFCLILIAIFISITYFESYNLGVLLKGRTITSKEQLAKEVNTLNIASSFIPQGKGNYFKLNGCTTDMPNSIGYNDGTNYYDTALYNYNDTNFAKIRKALKEPDVFSYKNYCTPFLNLWEYPQFDTQWVQTKNRWIDNKRQDSIRYIIKELLAISKKYGVTHQLNPQLLSTLVFADSFNNVTRTFANNYAVAEDGNTKLDYYDETNLNRALNFIDECYLDQSGYNNWNELFTVELYVTLCMAILLLCYRLYSRKIFLISVVGTIVWAIVFALLAATSGGESSIAYFYFLLFGLFIGVAIASLNNKTSKTTTGVLLNWHMYMLPFIVMLIMMLIIKNYHDHQYYDMYGKYVSLTEEQMQQRYPIGYWVNNHSGLIFRLNLLLVFLYTAFVFTRLSKKWHMMPEE